MAVGKWFGPALGKVLGKQIDLVNDTIKVALVTGSYSPNVDTHDEWADVSANEASGTGYTAGGVALSSKTLTYDSTNNYWTFDAADIAWSGVTLSFRYAVIYDDTATGKPLLGYVDFGSSQSATNQDVGIKWEFFYQDPESMAITTDSGILRATV
ncbi:hypothetical protein [Streptomyces sp. C1-2]|uniref:hypothetical protein n=1 Tax=Streptomyces sp. C1-2 TaxID=2720022 RepID=UPI0019D1CFF9|nr:hypothetical protein [Streptomyces sp. C1-2]